MASLRSGTSEYRHLFPYIDFDFYRLNYGDVSDPVEHYMDNWRKTNIDPSRFFSTSFYLRSYPDVLSAGINPLLHYIKHGEREGRRPRDTTDIERDYPNISASSGSLRLLSWEIPCIFNDEKISNNPYDGDNGLLNWLVNVNASSLIVNRKSDDWVVSFAGRGEHFFFLKKFSEFSGNILLLRDKAHKYYNSGLHMPFLDGISSYIDYHTGIRAGRNLLVGQSYGGYCALYQSSFIKNCVSFGFSPQAFHPDSSSAQIYFEKGINKVNPQVVPDLVKHVSRGSGNARYVVSGMSEAVHAMDYYWGDILSATLLASTGNATAIIVNQHEHSTARYLDGKSFLELVFENFEIFYGDTKTAAKLFADRSPYYKK